MTDERHVHEAISRMSYAQHMQGDLIVRVRSRSTMRNRQDCLPGMTTSVHIVCPVSSLQGESIQCAGYPVELAHPDGMLKTSRSCLTRTSMLRAQQRPPNGQTTSRSSLVHLTSFKSSSASSLSNQLLLDVKNGYYGQHHVATPPSASSARYRRTLQLPSPSSTMTHFFLPGSPLPPPAYRH